MGAKGSVFPFLKACRPARATVRPEVETQQREQWGSLNAASSDEAADGEPQNGLDHHGGPAAASDPIAQEEPEVVELDNGLETDSGSIANDKDDYGAARKPNVPRVPRARGAAQFMI